MVPIGTIPLFLLQAILLPELRVGICWRVKAVYCLFRWRFFCCLFKLLSRFSFCGGVSAGKLGCFLVSLLPHIFSYDFAGCADGLIDTRRDNPERFADDYADSVTDFCGCLIAAA